MRRSIGVNELPESARASLRELREEIRAAGRETEERIVKTRDRSEAARKRVKTGSNFEDELDFTHRQYEFAHIGKIWTHSPPFVMVQKKWTPKAGGGPIDRTGHVCVRIRRDSGPLGRDNIETWEGVSKFGNETKYIVPVAFDAKVLGAGAATYQHEKKRQHQLFQLRDASSAGVAAFLLVSVPHVGRVFMIPIQNHFSDLISGRGVLLYELRRPKTQFSDREVFPLLPSIERSGYSSEAVGWNWIPLLQWCQPDADDFRETARESANVASDLTRKTHSARRD